MEAPKVPTLDLKNKRKPPTAGPIATDDDHNLSVIDPGGDYGQQSADEGRVVMSSTQVNYSRTTTATRRYDQFGNVIEGDNDVSLCLFTDRFHTGTQIT